MEKDVNLWSFGRVDRVLVWNIDKMECNK